MNITEALKEHAKTSGADIVGIANIGRFDELPERRHPGAIFPEAKSVIVLARRITRGSLRGAEEGTNFGNYMFYGYNWLDNRFLPLTTFKTAEFLEDNGWEAVPLPNLPPEVPPMGVSVRPGSPEPNVMLDFDDAAVRAGIGEIGYCGVLITPEFGPRQRVQLILTDAELKPDPLLTEPVCPGRDSCKIICPPEAFRGEKEIIIAGKKMLTADIDYTKCRSCKNGAAENIYHPAGKPDRIGSVCIRSCADQLEKAGRIKNRFKTPFRSREPWTIKEEIDFYKTNKG